MNATPNEPDAQQTQSLGKIMAICAWVIALMMLTFFFNQWSKKDSTKMQTKWVTVDGVGETIIPRNENNQYLLQGKINDTPVIFLVDTGATDVVIPGKLAEKLKLKKGPQTSAHTAGGTIQVNFTKIDALNLGNMTIHQVIAIINPSMEGEEILLGMSALKKVTFYQQNDTIVITADDKK